MSITRIVLKSLKYSVLAIVILLTLDIAVLAFPQPWFEHTRKIGPSTVWNDQPIEGDLARAATDAVSVLAAAGLDSVDLAINVYLCGEPWRFAAAARLIGISPSVRGVNLSLFNESFVSLPNVRYHCDYQEPLPHSSTGGSLS